MKQVSEDTIRQYLREQSPKASRPAERLEVDINGVTDHEVQTKRPSDRRQHRINTYRNNITIRTIFGTVILNSKTFILRHSSDLCDDDSMLDEDDFERKTSVRVHPASWLIRLGVSYGLQMTLLRSIQGWRQTLDTYRAVPDGSEIFKHCRNGNLHGVKMLMSMGKASVWDSDTYGRTPLHVSFYPYMPTRKIKNNAVQFAAESWQSEVCQVLLEAGASRSARAHQESGGHVTRST